MPMKEREVVPAVRHRGYSAFGIAFSNKVHGAERPQLSMGAPLKKDAFEFELSRIW
jgi:hypothetical protein